MVGGASDAEKRRRGAHAVGGEPLLGPRRGGCTPATVRYRLPALTFDTDVSHWIGAPPLSATRVTRQRGDTEVCTGPAFRPLPDGFERWWWSEEIHNGSHATTGGFAFLPWKYYTSHSAAERKRKGWR